MGTETKIAANEEDSLNSNNFLKFNSNVGLKARLYNKNKELMEKVILSLDQSSQTKTSGQRDSIMDLFDSLS